VNHEEMKARKNEEKNENENESENESENETNEKKYPFGKDRILNKGNEAP